MTYFSPNFTFMMIARVLTAASTALVVVLSLTIAVKIVAPAHRAKALGLIYMGISSSLVLGVPLGIQISNMFGWRVIFLGIAVLSIGSMALITLFLDRIPGEKTIPLSQQIKAVGSGKIISAHLATMFMLAGQVVEHSAEHFLIELALGKVLSSLSVHLQLYCAYCHLQLFHLSSLSQR